MFSHFKAFCPTGRISIKVWVDFAFGSGVGPLLLQLMVSLLFEICISGGVAVARSAGAKDCCFDRLKLMLCLSLVIADSGH